MCLSIVLWSLGFDTHTHTQAHKLPFYFEKYHCSVCSLHFVLTKSFHFNFFGEGFVSFRIFGYWNWGVEQRDWDISVVLCVTFYRLSSCIISLRQSFFFTSFPFTFGLSLPLCISLSFPFIGFFSLSLCENVSVWPCSVKSWTFFIAFCLLLCTTSS